MAWMETDYSKHKRLEYLGTLGIMGETAPLIISCPSGGPLHVQGILGTVGKMTPKNDAIRGALFWAYSGIGIAGMIRIILPFQA